MKKIIIAISISVVLIISCILGILQYEKYKKTTLGYAVKVIGNAFATGEEKYISALEELMDSDKEYNAFIFAVAERCFDYQQPLYKDSNSNSYIRKLVVRQQVREALDHIRKAINLAHRPGKSWEQRIEKIEYIKRRIAGKLTDIAIVSVKMQSGLVFKINFYKENNTWIPRDLVNADENICKWPSIVGPYAKAMDDGNYDHHMFQYIFLTITSREEEPGELERIYIQETKKILNSKPETKNDMN